jgi:NADPH2:quinone reductase
MKAVRVTRFGPPSVLLVAQLQDPAPGPGEISIDVAYAAVGLVDVFMRQGLFKDMPGMPQPPFIPGLEVSGTVRALGPGVEGFLVGEPVVSMSGGSGTGGYASVFIAPTHGVISLANTGIDPSLAVAAVPNAAMAQVALTEVAHLNRGDRVLIHGALGGFAAAFAGMAKHLGASHIAGTVRASKLEAAARTKLPYDRIVDSSALPDNLAGERFDVIIDAVGGAVRDQSFALMKPGSRLVVVGNASGDWANQIKTNDLWIGSATVAGFNAGAYLPSHPQTVRPALEAAILAVAADLCTTDVSVMAFDEAALAHERMESRALDGRIVLAP